VKRLEASNWIRRVATLTVSSNTYTPNVDSADIAIISSPTANFTIANPTGTPTDGQSLILRITSSGTTYTPTWGTNYVGTSVSLPTTLVASKTITVGFSYDATAGKWVCLAADTTGY